MKQITMNIPDEVYDLGEALVLIAKDIKAGKTAMQIGTDTLPLLLDASGKLANLGADLKDPQVHQYLGGIVAQMADALAAPAPAAAAPAAQAVAAAEPPPEVEASKSDA